MDPATGTLPPRLTTKEPPPAPLVALFPSLKVEALKLSSTEPMPNGNIQPRRYRTFTSWFGTAFCRIQYDVTELELVHILCLFIFGFTICLFNAVYLLLHCFYIPTSSGLFSSCFHFLNHLFPSLHFLLSSVARGYCVLYIKSVICNIELILLIGNFRNCMAGTSRVVLVH